MKKHKYFTNLTCFDCIKSITPLLDKMRGFDCHKAHKTDKISVIEVTADHSVQSEVMQILRKSGFIIEVFR